jgi:REase_DpnII-MboI
MRDERPLWRLGGALDVIRRRVEALEPTLNANRVAQYEFHHALRALAGFAQSGARADLDRTRERFGRVLVMLEPDDRRELAVKVAHVIEAAETMTEEERVTLAADWGGRYGKTGDDETTPAAGAIMGDEIEFIRRVMQSLPHGLDCWTWEAKTKTRNREGRFWHVDNEIHVQNLLWLALAPALPELKREETLPKLGGHSSRADLALPRLQLAIEAKFVRSPAAFKRVRDEIAADSELYTSAHSSPYSRLMVLVWDNTRSSERHPQLLAALKSFRGVVDAVVVSRPGRMQDPVA